MTECLPYWFKPKTKGILLLDRDFSLLCIHMNELFLILVVSIIFNFWMFFFVIQCHFVLLAHYDHLICVVI